ncbi:MAG: GGDEF domain-containing protein, partial [Anaerolineales bacterium]
IADDDRDFRRMLTRRASKMGLEIVEAKNGAEAIEHLSDADFDALVVDLYMPEHNGLEVFEAARKKDPEVVALILTGSASVETAVEALRAGVFDYLTKPLESLATFDLALTRALQHRFLVSENKRLFDEVQRLAVTDSLTSVYNRHKLIESLTLEIERARRYDRPLSIIMIDMDRLKSINDTYGHAAGDEALILVADSIKSCIRKVDLPTRFGGDEFMILLPETDLNVAMGVAERICLEVDQRKFEHGTVSISAGISQWVPEHATGDDLLKAVDKAMYDSKQSRGMKVSISDRDA